MVSSIRIAGALAVPLLLAGCGLPVGVQIASLLADGISVVATDKTLTDHGLSAVTDQDCSLWRGVEGQDICREADDATLLADAAAASKAKDAQTPPEQDWGAADAAAQENKNIARRETPEFLTEEPAAPAVAPSLSPVTPAPVTTAALTAPAPTTPPATPVRVDSFAASWAPVTSMAKAPPPAPKAVPVKLVRAPKTMPGAVPKKTGRQIYYVIASYHRANGAERFARRHSRLEPVVLAGTAKGRRVFRVAVGPVAPEGRKTTKMFLKNRGFGDAWALRATPPKAATEVASLR